MRATISTETHKARLLVQVKESSEESIFLAIHPNEREVPVKLRPLYDMAFWLKEGTTYERATELARILNEAFEAVTLTETMEIETGSGTPS